MAELAAVGSDSKKGLVCPICECRDFRVYYTRPKDGAIMRRRVCRHCGRLVTTFEKVT